MCLVKCNEKNIFFTCQFMVCTVALKWDTTIGLLQFPEKRFYCPNPTTNRINLNHTSLCNSYKCSDFAETKPVRFFVSIAFFLMCGCHILQTCHCIVMIVGNGCIYPSNNLINLIPEPPIPQQRRTGKFQPSKQFGSVLYALF